MLLSEVKKLLDFVRAYQEPINKVSSSYSALLDDFNQINFLLEDTQFAVEIFHTVQELEILKTRSRIFNDKIDSNINFLSKVFKNKSQNFHQINYKFDTYEYQPYKSVDIQQQYKTVLSDKDRSSIEGLLTKYCSWQYPALQFGCRDIQFTRSMVASDPLFIADFELDNLQNTLWQFNDSYRKKIPQYLLRKNLSDIGVFPPHSYGLIFSWDLFTYFNTSSIKIILGRLFWLLRPGGHLIFNYNNCDKVSAIQQVEKNIKGFTDAHTINQLLTSIGYKIITHTNDLGDLDWVDACHPGKINSKKIHPTMGEIIVKA